MTDIVIPGKVLDEAGLSRSEFLIDFAVYLYDKERLTMGQARKLAGLDQLAFQKALAERNVCIHYDEHDLHEDLHNLQQAGAPIIT